MQKVDILLNSNIKNNIKFKKDNIKGKENKFYDLLKNKVVDENTKELKKYEVRLDNLDKRSNDDVEQEDLKENIFNNQFRDMELIDINTKEINSENINIENISEDINKILETIEKLIYNFNNDNINQNEKDNILQEIKFSMAKLNVMKLNIELNKLINSEELNSIKSDQIKEINMLIKSLNLEGNEKDKGNIKIDIESQLNKNSNIELNLSNNESEKILEENKTSKEKDLVEKREKNNLELNISNNNDVEKKTLTKSIDSNKENIVLDNDMNFLKTNIVSDKIQIKTGDSIILNEKFNVIEQIKDNINIIDKGEFKSAIINLKPESLGSININIDMNEGKFIGKIIVENIDIKTLLENNLNELKESFSSKGLNIENFTVSVGKENLSDSKNRNFFNYYKNSKDIDSEDIDDENYTVLNFENYGSEHIISGSLDFKA